MRTWHRPAAWTAGLLLPLTAASCGRSKKFVAPPPTASALGGAVHWLIETDAVQQYLRTAVTIDLAPTIEKGRALAEENLNRELAPGVLLHTTLKSAEPVGVWAGTQALVARVLVTGQGSITVHLKPPPRTGKAPRP